MQLTPTASEVEGAHRKTKNRNEGLWANCHYCASYLVAIRVATRRLARRRAALVSSRGATWYDDFTDHVHFWSEPTNGNASGNICAFHLAGAAWQIAMEASSILRDKCEGDCCRVRARRDKNPRDQQHWRIRDGQTANHMLLEGASTKMLRLRLDWREVARPAPVDFCAARVF